MIVDTQFEELLQTLDLKWNQPFEFNVTYKTNLTETPKLHTCYFKENEEDKLYNVYDDTEFTATLTLDVNTEVEEVITKEFSNIVTDNNYIDIGVEGAKAGNPVSELLALIPDPSIYIGCICQAKDATTGETKQQIITEESDGTITFITNADPFGTLFYGQVPYHYDEEMGPSDCRQNFYVSTLDSTVSIQILVPTTVIKPIPTDYYPSNGDDADDIRRKIYTGAITINTAPYERLTEDEQFLIELLVEQGYTYLCGTPTKELYAFKAKDINNLNVGTMILNGGGQTRGWYHPNYFGATSSTQSLGHKINTIFKPLQSNSQFLYLKLPQINGVLNEEEFDKMIRGFITIGSKA